MSTTRKKSVVRVKNNDNNCFWYSLVNLIYMSGKEFDQPVSIEYISEIEDKLVIYMFLTLRLHQSNILQHLLLIH